jgi:hypothetical protein
MQVNNMGQVEKNSSKSTGWRSVQVFSSPVRQSAYFSITLIDLKHRPKLKAALECVRLLENE